MKTFISQFKARFLKLAGFEYEHSISDVDKRLVSMVCDMLRRNKHSITKYLNWLFDEFLVNNPKFCPPTLRWACCRFVMDTFLYEHRKGAKGSK